MKIRDLLIKKIYWAILLILLGKGMIHATPVEIISKDDKGFEIRTGDYTVCYNRASVLGSKDKVLIYSINTSQKEPPKSIGTVFVNGESLNPLHSTRNKTLSYEESKDNITILFNSRTSWGSMDSRLVIYKKYPGLIGYKTEIQPNLFFVLHDNPLECTFGESGHRVQKYFAQMGPSAGMLYFYDREMDATVLYWQDYTSLNDLYRLTGFENPYNSGVEKGWSEGPVTMKVWGQPEPYSIYFTAAPAPPPVEKTFVKDDITTGAGEFGYERPANLKIPSGKKVCLCDAYLYLTPGFDDKSFKFCKRFVEMQSVVYKHIQKPPLEKIDWTNEVVPKLINELNKPYNWSKPSNGMEYLTAYIKDKRGPYGELITQLEILVPLTEFVKRHPENKPAAQLVEKLAKNLPTFWDDSAKTFSDGVPPVSIIQSGWYFFFPGQEMSDLAKLGNKDAQRMFQDEREFYLKVGKQYKYQFAIFNLQTGKEEHVYEYDVTGLFLNIMMDYYDLSAGKDTECLEAAKKAAEVIAGHEFRYGYEMNYTASGSVGLYRLYQATGDKRYKDLAFIPLANVLRWAGLWECDYGVGEQVRTFWNVCPTAANHCLTEHENHHNRRYLRDFYKLAYNDLTPEIRELLSDSWKYGPMESYDAIPPVLIQKGLKWSLVKEGGDETASGVPNLWEIDYNAWVPLEDAHAGWCREPNWYDKNPKNGTVGQEIYGSGGIIWYSLWQDEDSGLVK